MNAGTGPAAGLFPWRAVDRVLRRSGAAITFSQEGEDRLLERLLEGHPVGGYVDVGAHDPVRFSNTMSLYMRGWRGLAIEPSAEAGARFRRLRPLDTFVPVAVGSQSGAATFFRFNEPALNTLEADVAKALVAEGQYHLIGTTRVDVRRLDDLLSAFPVPEPFGLLTVDCEGRDLDVLESSDWQRFRPSLVCCEAFDEEAQVEIDSAMRRWGYAQVASTMRSRVYGLPLE